jgi:hypothetical protein
VRSTAPRRCSLPSCTACGIRGFDSELEAERYQEVPLEDLPGKYRLTEDQLVALADMPIVEMYAEVGLEARDVPAVPDRRRQALAPVVSCYPPTPQLGEGQSDEDYAAHLRSTVRYHLHSELVEERVDSDSGDTKVRSCHPWLGRFGQDSSRVFVYGTGRCPW